jgi:hypothetical protein
MTDEPTPDIQEPDPHTEQIAVAHVVKLMEQTGAVEIRFEQSTVLGENLIEVRYLRPIGPQLHLIRRLVSSVGAKLYKGVRDREARDVKPG